MVHLATARLLAGTSGSHFTMGSLLLPNFLHGFQSCQQADVQVTLLYLGRL